MATETIRRILANTWQNIWRNKLISISTVIVMAVIIFIFNFVLNLNFTAGKILANIQEKININVDLQEAANEFSIQSLRSDLAGIPEIKEIIYISKDDALKNFQETFPEMNLGAFLQRFNEPNPLPASLSIVAADISYNQKIIDFLSQTKYRKIIDIEKLNNNVKEQVRVNRLISITKFIYQSGIFLNIIFVFIAMLLIFNAIRMIIYFHRKTINIMRLVGATFSYIRTPFLLEGCIFGVSSTVIASALIFFFFYKIKGLSESIFRDEDINQALSSVINAFYDNFSLIFTIETAVIIIFALAGSFLAIQSYLLKEENIN